MKPVATLPGLRAALQRNYARLRAAVGTPMVRQLMVENYSISTRASILESRPR